MTIEFHSGEHLQLSKLSRARMNELVHALDPFQPIAPIRLGHVVPAIKHAFEFSHAWEGPAGDAWIDGGGTKD